MGLGLYRQTTSAYARHRLHIVIISPGIIKAELAQVRQPDASSELSTTENITVKVSPASGEVMVSYMMDEQALEPSIRMPSDWLLHRLEVRDTKMMDVSEDKWRAWVLGV